MDEVKVWLDKINALPEPQRSQALRGVVFDLKEIYDWYTEELDYIAELEVRDGKETT